MACGATLSLKRSLEFDPLHSPNRSPNKRRRCVPMTMSPTVPPTKQHQTNPSPFTDVSPKITSEHIAAHLSAELKRMHRRKQLQYPTSSSPPPSCSSSAMQLCSMSPTHDGSSSPTHSLSSTKKDAPLFTFRQVSMVCERMMKDREEQIREEYDKVLTCKLAEQYEAFLKFNHDQLQRRIGEEAASYVS